MKKFEMKEILETVQLEFDQSSFLIELVRHTNDRKYIEINQTIYENKADDNLIKINPSVLGELIEVLLNYKDKISDERTKDSNRTWDEKKRKIQRRYLKGIPIKDLVLQFGYSKNFIETILRNSGIEIVSNRLPKTSKRRKKI